MILDHHAQLVDLPARVRPSRLTAEQAFSSLLPLDRVHSNYPAQNLLANSNTFDPATWSTFGSVTVTPNFYVGPYGGAATAAKFDMGAANSGIECFVPEVVGDWLFSVWVKLISGNAAFRITYDTVRVTPVIVSVTATGTWQRITLPVVGLQGRTDSQISIHKTAGEAAGVFAFWGAQLNAGLDLAIPNTDTGASGATPSYVRRQNSVTHSEAFDSWTAFGGASVVSDTSTPPIVGGGGMADQITLPNSLCGVTGACGLDGHLTFGLWVRLISGDGNFALGYSGNFDGGDHFLEAEATSAWQFFTLTTSFGDGFATSNVSFQKNVTMGDAGVFEIFAAQVNQGTQLLAYRPTGASSISSIEAISSEYQVFLSFGVVYGVKRLSDGAVIAIGGAGWQDYLDWVALGNGPSPPDIPPTYVTDAAAALAAGLPIISTGTPAINATYAIDDGSMAAASEFGLGSKAGYAVPTGFTYPDILGTQRTMTALNMTNLYLALRDYTWKVKAYGRTGTGSLPSKPVTIA